MLRILPYVIICLVMFLGTKVLDIFDSNNITDLNVTEVGVAADSVSISNEGNNTNKDKAQPLPVVHKQEKVTQERNNIRPNPDKDKKHVNEFTPVELEILKNLKSRREELEQRASELSFKENTLLVTEQNIDMKLTQLKQLQQELGVIMQQYEEKEMAKASKLVKIYENMKPKDAARIFEELQLNVLLNVAENMKEARLAPIVASMDPIKAKELTVALATKRQMIRGYGQ